MKPQPFAFVSLEDFLEFITDNEKKLFLELDALIFECVPQIKRKLSYNVPFYSLKQRAFFIWPASVPWGKVQLNGVQLGFCKGYLIEDELQFLDRGNRKQVCTKTYFKMDEVTRDRVLLKHYLFEALKVDTK